MSHPDEPEALELDLAPETPVPARPRGRTLPLALALVLAVGVVCASAQAHKAADVSLPPPPAEVVEEEEVAEVEEVAEPVDEPEEVVRRHRNPLAPLMEEPAEPLPVPTPAPPPEVLAQSVEETEEYLQVKAVLLARNADAAEKLANERMALHIDDTHTTFRRFADQRDAAQGLKSLARRLDRVDVQADPYAAVALVTDALERIEPAGVLKDNERAKLNRAAAMLGELGEQIVANRDEARYPLAKRALEAANRWQGREDGQGEYQAALAELDQRAVRALTKARANHEPLEPIAQWAPTRGQAQNLTRTD